MIVNAETKSAEAATIDNDEEAWVAATMNDFLYIITNNKYDGVWQQFINKAFVCKLLSD